VLCPQTLHSHAVSDSMDILPFLETVITASQGGWLSISSSAPDGTDWHQQWRAWPDDADSAVTLIEGLRDSGRNVYFSAHLFREKSTEKQYAMPSRTLFADLDGADVARILPRPTLLVKSSDNRHQCYWILSESVTQEQLEELAQRAAWGIPHCDTSGYTIGHMMRVPNTQNFKYKPDQRVRVVSNNKQTFRVEDFGIFPPIDESMRKRGRYQFDDAWIQKALVIPTGFTSVDDIWDKFEKKISEDIARYYYNESDDRSAALFALVAALFHAGATREEAYIIAYKSQNNKFADLRYNGERELAKDVLRIQYKTDTNDLGIRDIVNKARQQTNASPALKRQAIADMTRNSLMNKGQFIHARGGTLWYLDNTEGRPISVSRVSTQLNVLLDNQFGLIATEAEHGYVVNHLINYCASLPQTGQTAALSYYMPERETLLLHTGTSTVIRITPDAIDTVVNGYNEIIFPWEEEAAFEPIIDTPLTDWSTALFGNALDNLATENMTPEYALALVRSWFMMLMFRSACVSRPILAVFGQPGSGKSTLFRRMLVLLYGKYKGVSGVTTADHFDTQMSTDALLVLDNVDTWERWLPDRIARSAAISEIKKRKLYTDADVITMRSQAMLCITAHNPKFGREDVTDRLILLTLERLQDTERLKESAIIDDVLVNRDHIWGAIIRDIQRVLCEPEPPDASLPSFRVADYAAVGQRVANALGYPDDFYKGVTSLVSGQKSFVLDEDSMLVDLLGRMIQSKGFDKDTWKSAAKIWATLDVLNKSQDFGKQYGNSIKLGKKLWAMQDALKQRFIIESRMNITTKLREWRIRERNEKENEIVH
jgi:energy-coupling factor transporter ATP-binding protein EcfA2